MLITFNHDLVVENTLAEVSAAKGRLVLAARLRPLRFEAPVHAVENG